MTGKTLFRFLRLVKLGLRRLKTRNFSRPEYNPRFLKAWNLRWPHQIVAKNTVRAYDLKRRYFDTARFDAGYTDLKKFTLEKRWMPFVPIRMENCTLMAAARKIDYRWPLLDMRLVKLWLSIPAEENYCRGMGRYLHRRAVDGVVPKMVTWKRSKDMGSMIGPDFGGDLRVRTDFVENLHPVLKELVDIEKLAKQAAYTTSAGNPGQDGLPFQRRRNLMAVKELDQWLRESSSHFDFR